FMEELYSSLVRINKDLPLDVIESAIFNLQNIEAGSLVQRNRQVMDWLQNGMEVTYMDKGEEKTAIVYLIDYDEENIDNNSFVVTNQWTVSGVDQVRRPDIVIFINGLPLVVVELKSGSAENVDISSAYRQIKNYQKDIPELFVYNAFNIISDLTYSKAGTITSSEEWYKEWKTIDGSREDTRIAAYDVLFKGMLDKTRILDIIKNFILFEDNIPEDTKIIAQYHQYYAVKKAVDSTLKAVDTDGRAGVFWHTQGSGKSLSMVFYVKSLYKYLENPTFVVITDRNDLDDQLYNQFAKVKDFLRQTPQQANSRDHLRELLDGRLANGIFFTTMQKFSESKEPLTERSDIIVISDEAHRSQYGLKEVIKKDGSIQVGMARIVRDSLPNASYIGFTGTPISAKDRDTREVFGDYIDIYDMTQAVEDGATKPIYYENRVMNLGLDEDLLEEIDAKYEELATQATEEDITKSKRELGKLESILGSESVIETLCTDIIKHYEEERAHLLTGKAMIVAYNRRIAMKVYKKILELRPEWEEKVKLVITGSNNDPEEWKEIVGNKNYKKELAKRFKDNKDPFKIAIVVDMWLTGFDVPSLATMYVYKPMKGHNLMQAIARVNRVFEDKEGGLVVDYIGIAKALKEAMNDYTVRDRKNFSNPDIREQVYPKFKEKLEVCSNEFLYGLEYSDIFRDDVSDRVRSDLITEGINHIYRLNEKMQKSFREEAYILRQAHSLCSSITTKEEQRLAAYIEAIRIGISRIREEGKISLKEINRQIEELLENSIRSEGVINLFSDIDMEFSIFDENFLYKILNMKQKNLAIELMHKLLKEEVKLYSRTDIVKSEEFSKRIKRVMEEYRRSQIANARSLDELYQKSHRDRHYSSSQEETENEYHVERDDINRIIESLINIARDIVEADKNGDRMGLTKEELSFYHALTFKETIEEYYEDEVLVEMAKELTRELRENESIDWQYKESGRARMRTTVRRLLRKYNYPPEEMKEALDIVLRQCEHWSMRRLP
ncbi:MAG: type I restriction endonuclease subunit R, partial [Clostridiales bacterium]|nr:type I restriction endonuclease subunit R [Clostridiales bacterium]